MSYSFWWCFWNRCHHMMSHFQTARCQKSIFRADIRFVGRLKQPQNVWPFLALTTFHRFVGPSCNQNPTHWMACAGRQNDLMDVCGQAAAIIKHIVVRLRGEMLRTRRSHETEVVKQGHKPKQGSCYRWNPPIKLLHVYIYIGEIPQNQHTFAFALLDFHKMGYLTIPWWMLRKFIFLSMMFALFFLSSSEMLLNPWGIHAFLFQKTINNQAIAFILDEFLLWD